MKLKEIYDIFVREGIRAELRTTKQLQQYLRDKKREYQKIPPSKRKFFDKESLTNPYADTRLLYGDPGQDIQRILVGIDIGIGELLMARGAVAGGKECDLVLAHHPRGVALAGLHEVMHLQKDFLCNLGLGADIAKDLMDKRIQEVSRRVHGANHTRVVDAAKLLGVPLMCCHTPADNHVARYLQKLVDARKPKTLQHVVDLLLKEPEYQDAIINKAGPRILVGKQKDKAGRIVVDMTGGTEGSKDVFARLSQSGIRTILGMHLSETHFDKVRSEYMNVVIAGHMASDNLGMNLLLDKLEKRAKIEVVECSGFRRFRR